MPTLFSQGNFLILGAGVTGKSVGRVLKARGVDITLVDENLEKFEDFKIVKTSEVEISKYDALVVSPGWRFDHNLIQAALNLNIPLLNEIDIAWNLRSELAPNQRWVALTGTNGKTSTVELTAAMLRAGGLSAVACGNVGDTVIDAVSTEKPFDILVLELSSFQLHWCKNVEFVASAILNIAPDHIDWHGSFESYAQAKLSILSHSQVAILNAQDGEVVQRCNNWKGRKVFYSLETPSPGEIGLVEELLVDRAFVSDVSEASMFAELTEVAPMLPHNVSNTMAAAGLALAVGVSHEDIRRAIVEFRPGKHRIELIAEHNSIRWINDSKATNPHAAKASLKAYESIIWIAGGLAKGAEMDNLISDCSKNIKAAILIGSDRNLIEDAFNKFAPKIPLLRIDPEEGYKKDSETNLFMESIVRAAKDLATEGDVVLLAPACASMDQFLSYSDRGLRFSDAVKKEISHGA